MSAGSTNAGATNAGTTSKGVALWRVHKSRIDVPLMLVFAAVSLYFGLSTPLIRVEKAIVLSNDYSVWSGVVGLWEERDWLLAGVVFFFSFVFPIAKLILLFGIWFTPVPQARRVSLLNGLETLGRWSMLDVFVVAILVVATKLEPLASIYPRPGVHWFLAAVLVSMVTTYRVRNLATS
jgi:paraquat-inducible protein A